MMKRIKRSNNILLILILLFINGISCAEKTDLDLISNVDMFDIGLAKINNDEYYDIYTLNHEYAESILLANKNGFEESSIQLGLSQTGFIPEYEPTGLSPELREGLNIYSARRKQLIMICQNCKKSVKGTVKIPTPKNDSKSVTLIHKEEAKLTKKLLKTDKDGDFILIEFNLDENGLIVIDTKFMDVKMEFEIDYPFESIFLGPHSNRSKSNKFSIKSRDNHSFAWAKVDNNIHTDVFMTTGGLRAKIKEFKPSQIIQELFYTFNLKTNKFINQYPESGFKKGTCRTYKSEWVDFDNDGDLDLYNGCKNGNNQMYQQQGIGSGKFIEVANNYEVDFYHADEFKWIDFDNDNNQDLLTIQKNKLMIYKNLIDKHKVRTFKLVKKSKLLGHKLGSVTTSIKPIDVDNDGKPEIFVSTGDKVYYFEYKQKKGFVEKKLDFLDLPSDLSGKLNFVDINLDGYLDICVFNNGIFLQKSNHKFKKSDKLSELFKKKKYVFKNLIWFDADINGIELYY